MSRFSFWGEKTVISTRFRSVFAAAMFSMASAYVLILTDNVAAGQLVGENAVVSMTLVFPLITFIIFVSYLIADGLAMMLSYAQGRGDRERVNQLFSMGVLFGKTCWLFGRFRHSSWAMPVTITMACCFMRR